MFGDLLLELVWVCLGELVSECLLELCGVISLVEWVLVGFLYWQGLLGLVVVVGVEELCQCQVLLQFDELINIQYIFGIIGFFKGVIFSYYNIFNNGYMVGESFGFGVEDCLVILVLLYYCFGMVMGNFGCVIYGLIMIYLVFSFDVEVILLVVVEECVIVLYGVLIMFIVELDYLCCCEFDFFSLCIGIMVGVICLIEVMWWVIGDMYMVEVQIVYGMIEISLVLLQIGLDDGLELCVIIVGCIQLRLESKIVDQMGRVVLCGEIGELCICGYSVMFGYWNDFQVIVEVIDLVCWMYIGDLVVMDDDGYVWIVGCSKDMIICGGENIYLCELEEFFFIYLVVVDVQVIGIFDECYGEEIVVWIKLYLGYYVDDEQLWVFCKVCIVYFKILCYFRFVDEFLMIVIGKIQKFCMCEISIEEICLFVLCQGCD